MFLNPNILFSNVCSFLQYFDLLVMIGCYLSK